MPAKAVAKPFKPWNPVVARALAHQAGLLYQANPELVAGPHCVLCVHAMREEIDYLLLVGSTVNKINKWMLVATKGEWSYRKLVSMELHRDEHLIPLINEYLVPKAGDIRKLPYPVDGDERAKGLYYLFQHMGIFYSALEAGQLHNANLALKEMRLVERDMLVERPRLPTQVDGREPDKLEDFGDRDAKLQEAFRRSSRRRDVDEGVVEDGAQNESGSPQNA